MPYHYYSGQELPRAGSTEGISTTHELSDLKKKLAQHVPLPEDEIPLRPNPPADAKSPDTLAED